MAPGRQSRPARSPAVAAARGWLWLLAVALAALALWVLPRSTTAVRTIAIASRGVVEGAELEALRARLVQSFGVAVRIRSERLSTPVVAGQQDGLDVLAEMSRWPAGRAERILAVSAADGGRRGMDFILGLGQQPGRCCVVFTERLRSAADAATFRARLHKVAIHELGHVTGLRHCTAPRCVMQFVSSLPALDASGTEFCGSCARYLRWWRRLH